MGDQIRNRKVKGQIHWEWKRKKSFSAYIFVKRWSLSVKPTLKWSTVYSAHIIKQKRVTFAIFVCF